MLRFSGEIDFRVLAAPVTPLAVQSRNEFRGLASPGLALRWNARHADLQFHNGTLALAIGHARGASRSGASEAARWLDRYQRLAESAADEVGGGFSVVIVDFSKRCAMVFVDRFGIEPLCYRIGDATLGFADTACDVPGSTKTLSRQSLFDYLYFHVIPAPRTVYGDVLRLEPAHRLTASAASTASARYWKPQFAESDHGQRSERMVQFVDLVRRAVDEEAEESSTACFLSGGTDSSTIAGVLTRLRGVPAHAYSIGFEEKGYDEMAYARIAARHFGLVHHEYYVTPDDLVGAIPKMAASFDQPFGNSSVLPAYFCALRAREDGSTRLLAGDGGDELFGGNSRYAMQKAFEVYHALPRRLRHTVLEPAACNSALFRGVPGFRQLGGYVRHSRAEMPDRLNAFNLLHFVGIEALLDPDFRAGLDEAEPIELQRETWAKSTAGSLVNRMLEYDWKFTLGDSDLPKVRAAVQLANMTVGYPFLSRELADFSLHVPPDWKVKGFTLRWFFKRALRSFLPNEILRKKKHGFGLPFGTWALRHSGLRDLAEDALRGIAERGIVRPAIANELLTTRLPQEPGFYGELVWILMMLELWMRSHETSVSLATSEETARPASLAAGGRR